MTSRTSQMLYSEDISVTSRERPKSALYPRLKIVEGDPLGFVKFQLIAKYEKIEGGPLEDIKKFPKKKLLKRNF